MPLFTARPPRPGPPRPGPPPWLQLIHSGFAKGEFMSQTLVALPLAYICGCAYFSLFKLGIFGGFYHMVRRGGGWADPWACRKGPSCGAAAGHLLHVPGPQVL